MRTRLMLILASMAALSAGTTVFAEQNATEDTTATGVYSLYNVTGENLKEIYLYEAGNEKGENLIPDGLGTNKKQVVTYEGAADATLVLEFTTDSDVTSSFETLHIEEVPIALLNADAVSGATPISFEIPEETGKYTFVNTTGEDVTELYVYPAEPEEAAEEETEAQEDETEAETEVQTETEDVRGENLAKDGLKDGESVEFSYTGAVDTELIVEFTTEKDGTKYFKTLHIEEAKINLLAEDDMTGATPIAFTF
ncbi:MAG: hypothetical protein ACI4EI_00845 [Muricoprocola sp.]